MLECPNCREEVKEGARKCPHCHEWLIPPPTDGKEEMQADDRIELAERRAAENVRAYVEKDLIKRYMGIGLIVAALTGGTITIFVKSNVDSALLGTHQRLAATEALQQRNLKTLDDFDKAMLRMNELNKNLVDLTTSASDTEKKFKELQKSADSLRRDQFASSKDVLDVAERLDEKISTLASVVRGFELDSAVIQRVDTLIKNPSTIPQVLARAEKRQYPIQLSNIPNASHIVEALSNGGYNASIFKSFDSEIKIPKNYQLIWISKNVPYDVAIDVIKTSLKFYPELNYIHIDGDFDFELEDKDAKLFLGATTERAESLGLKKVPSDFFPSLFSVKSQKAFHDLIRSTYGKPRKDEMSQK